MTGTRAWLLVPGAGSGGGGDAGPGSFQAWMGREGVAAEKHLAPQIRGELASGRGSPPLSSACPSWGPLPLVSNAFADQVIKGLS